MFPVARSLPKISYMKALDVYLAFCFCMVFGALLEFATVSYAGKRIKLNQRKFKEFQIKVIQAKHDVCDNIEIKVEEMRCELAKQMKTEDELVKIEDNKHRAHNENCPVKVISK